MTLHVDDITTSGQAEIQQMEASPGVSVFASQSNLWGEEEQIVRTKYLPEQTLDRYCREATRRLDVKRLETGEFFAEIPGFQGVWASDPDLEKCGAELKDVLLDWLILKIEQNDRDIPVVDGIDLNVL